MLSGGELSPLVQLPRNRMREQVKPSVLRCVMLKLTNSVVTSRMLEKGILLLGDYVAANIKSKVKCITCGYVWYAKPHAIFSQNCGCPECFKNSRRTSNEEFDSQIKDRNIVRLEDLCGLNKRIRFRCTVCNHEWVTTGSHILSGTGCAKCSRKAPLDPNYVTSKLKDKHIRMVGGFDTVDDRCNFVCMRCDYEWKTVLYAALYKTNCPRCSKKSPLTNEIVDDRIKDRDFVRKSDYKNYKTYLYFECLKCNFLFKYKPSDVFAGSGCPKCAKRGFNVGKPATVYIIEFLDYIGYGISNNVAKRLKDHVKSFKDRNIDYKIHRLFDTSGENAIKIENDLKSMFAVVDTGIKGFRKEATMLENLQKVLEFVDGVAHEDDL